jgi:hypothetical protein
MRKLVLAAGVATLALFATPASAVILNSGDIGASGTTNLQGFVDINGQATSIPGLTGTLFLEYTSLSLDGLTWSFDYTVTNTASLGTDARISSFGIGMTPNPIDANSTGLFDLALLNPSFPNVGGAQNIIDVCFSAGTNSCSGGDGLAVGASASGEFTLTFASVESSINLQTGLFRFQDVNSGAPYNLNGDSGVGFSQGDLVINPVVVEGIPEPSTWAMVLIGFAGVGFATYRKRKQIVRVA